MKKISKTDCERILSDITEFEKNVLEIPNPNTAKKEILELAKKYCEDTHYFLEKKDYVTAFGSINYAHGLLDALRKLESKKF